jgi:hypothetical protein
MNNSQGHPTFGAELTVDFAFAVPYSVTVRTSKMLTPMIEHQYQVQKDNIRILYNGVRSDLNDDVHTIKLIRNNVKLVHSSSVPHTSVQFSSGKHSDIPIIGYF